MKFNRSFDVKNRTKTYRLCGGGRVRFFSDDLEERVRDVVADAAMNVISEAEACRWLGRRVSVIVCEDDGLLIGRLQHVSSRSAFVLEEDRNVLPFGGTIRSVPLKRIERIVPAGAEDISR
ncbi:MAG: hypothetical protein JO036_06240 [Candidatus Eremiobacteraeota bacterium]|nr:hypothetical protein [Candidatus Eremiobacteraeota bacterium]